MTDLSLFCHCGTEFDQAAGDYDRFAKTMEDINGF
jgi:hypothetical protein